MRVDWRIGAVVLALFVGSGCEHIQEPWVSEGQYAQERERSSTRADMLRQRILTVQTDR